MFFLVEYLKLIIISRFIDLLALFLFLNIYIFPFSLFLSVYVYASFRDFVCIALLLQFVLGFCLSGFFCFLFLFFV